MSDPEGVKLFGYWSSPYSRRVEIALKMKGVEYEYIEEDLSNKSPLLLKYNPVHKKVPVLLHNGKPIDESLVILEYIDETWKSGPPILPKDPYQRARARFWAKFIDDKLLVALRKILTSRSLEAAEKATEEASDLLKTLENELKDNKFFGGESINLIDIAAGYVALWLGVLQEITGVQNLYTKEKFPRLSEWINEFLNCSIIKEKLPPRAELLAHLRPLFQNQMITILKKSTFV